MKKNTYGIINSYGDSNEWLQTSNCNVCSGSMPDVLILVNMCFYKYSHAEFSSISRSYWEEKENRMFYFSLVWT